ncbi:hypothetical protein CFC21_107837 [Triticum aestivum]|uniref:Leucine-rich repeat-containing N-terminal plant-type domain-containing protein n=2 Tax=Triticum aestivum TaxID=4565 RepID=A0A9R1MHS5_WHEAT|nr:hypothetical protein CFC21_107837 [Triticum aestivum]
MPRPCTMSPAMALLLCLAMLSSGGWCGGCRDDERATLLDIRGQFNYNSPLDWNSTDCCRWEGVSCSSPTARVTGLDLSILHSIASSRGLLNTTMFLPLQELQDLSLSGLKIQGCTPGAGFEVWSKLHRLKVLDLSYNGKLMESDVPSLVAILSLRSLFLNGNDFSSNMTIQQLSIMKLDTLDIGNNDIKGTIPTVDSQDVKWFGTGHCDVLIGTRRRCFSKSWTRLILSHFLSHCYLQLVGIGAAARRTCGGAYACIYVVFLF